MQIPKKLIIRAYGATSIAIIIFAASVLFVKATEIIDSFSDSSKIAALWNAQVATSTGELKLAYRTCDGFTWFCQASTTCANYAGDGKYIIVKQADQSGTFQWKTANTACVPPQCSGGGGENGDNLLPDNTITFTSYPARDACKSVGGRLPTIEELECIYDNRASFGSFSSDNYWSSTENSVANAWNYNFSGGNSNNNNKTNDNNVRCVRGRQLLKWPADLAGRKQHERCK